MKKTKIKKDLFNRIKEIGSENKVRGITLMSLVITIVVLIILAGVIISITLGNGGIIDKAKIARQEYANAQAKEQEDINDIYSKILVATDGTITANAEQLKSTILNIAYPVGSIMITTDSRNPGTYIGGTWQEYAKGKTIVGVDTNDTDFDTVEETGGEKKHTLTVNEMPSHTHSITNLKGILANPVSGGVAAGGSGNWKYSSPSVTFSLNATGGSESHNNLQPYIATYIWKRTN